MCVLIDVYLYLLKWSRTAKTENEKMSMGICAGKTLAIWSKLAVKNSSVALSFNLETQHSPNAETSNGPERHLDIRSYAQLSVYHVKEVHHSCSSLQIPHVHISIMTS